MSFAEIPDTLRVPGVYVEIDPTVATSGPGVFPLRAIVIGQRTSAGTVAAEIKKRTTSVFQAREEHGPGSISHLLAAAFIQQAPGIELDVISLDDDGAAVAQTWTITVSGTITTPGTLFLYVAGKRLKILAQTDSDTTAAAIVTAITAEPDLPVTAAATLSVVTLTAKNKGVAASRLDVRTNHLPGEENPGSLAFAIVAAISGTGNPDLGDVFTEIAGERYDAIVHAYTDPTNLDALKTELEARADALVGHPGMGYSGIMGSQSALAASGDARNNKFEVLVGTPTFPGWDSVLGAAVAGQAVRFLQADPVRPVTGRKPIPGYAPAEADRFTDSERNLLLHDGISTVRYDVASTTEVERLITTYQETGGGSPDESFLDVQTAYGLSFARRSFVAAFGTRFPNHKLADDGTPTPPGSAIVTPTEARAFSVGWYAGLVRRGVCEDLSGFIENSTFRRSGTDDNRLEMFLAIDFQNQLRIGATLFQFSR